MSEITNTATIKAVVDAEGVEVGLRKIDQSAAQTERALKKLGESNGVNTLGDGAEASAGRFANSTKTIVEAIQRRTLSMELGKKGTTEYYAALANSKGIDPAALKPYLDQLDAVTRKTAQAAEAQKKLDDGAAFINGLRARTEEIGKSASELATMRAAQLGVSETAQPLIEQLRAAEEAASGLGGTLGIAGTALQAFAAAAVAALSISAVAAGVQTAIDALAELDDMAQKSGSSVESLSQLQKVAQATGQDFGEVNSAINKLSKGMGGLDTDSNKVLGALKTLGVSAKDSAGKLRAPSEVMIEAAKKFQDYADGAGKAALANDLFKGSGADLLPYLNDVAEGVDGFSGASAGAASKASEFGDNIGSVQVRIGELWAEIATNMLPTLVNFSKYVKDITDSDGFKKFLVDAGKATASFASAVEKIAPAIIPAAEIIGTYFAVFVGAPKIMALAAAGLSKLYGIIGAGVVSVITSGGVWAGLTTILFGTGVAAQFAASWMGKLQVVAGVAFAFFAGWKIGTYLYEEFAWARIGGLMFVEALLIGFESVKFACKVAFDFMVAGWDAAMGVMKTAFGTYLTGVANGLDKIGAGEVSKKVSGYADSLIKSGAAQIASVKNVGAAVAKTAAEYEKNVTAIKANIAEMIAYESVAGNVVEAEERRKPKKTKPAAPTATEDDGAAAKQASAYASLVESIQSKIEANKLELLTSEAVSESQKLGIKLDLDLASGKLKLTAAQLTATKASLADLAVTEQKLKLQAAEKGVGEYIKQNTLARQASAAALASEYELYGKGSDARDITAVGLRNEADLQKRLAEMEKAKLPVTAKMIEQMRESAKVKTLDEQATLAQTKALGYAAQLAGQNEKYAAENLADPRARADALLKIDSDMWQQRIALAAEGTEARKLIEQEYGTWYANQQKKMVFDVDTTKANELLSTMSALDDLAKDAAGRMADSFGKVGKAIGGMTTAMSGFGKAQAAIAAEKANALARSFGDPQKIQDAQDKAASASARARLEEYGQMANAASGFFDEQSKGYAALQAASKVFHAAELALTLAELIPKGISAVLTQGSGDPYSAFGRMAAMAAIVTGLGVAISGGSGGAGGAKAADVQKTQGTGTVLGDTDAKSESLRKSLELIESNTYQGLEYSSGMLASLRNIESSMTGLNKLITRSPGVTDGSSFGIQTGQLNIGKPTDVISKVMTEVTKGLFGPGLGDKLASFINNIWGKTTKNIVDSGIRFGGSVNDLQAGKGYDQYASVDTTKSSFFGLSKKTTNSVQAAGLSEELSNQFGMVFTGLEETLRGAAVGLGLSADDVSKKLDGLVIATTTLSLKDLKGDELTAALNAVISKTMDQISEAAFPSFEQFRKVGEGYGETVIRIAQDFQAVNVVLASFGRVFGAVGLESIAARERLIEMTGGLEAFIKGAEYFSQNFLTEAERNAALSKRVNAAFADLGVSGISTRDQFKELVLGLDLTTEKGAKTYAGLMGIQEAFAQLNPAIEQVTEKVRTLAEIKTERAGLQDQFDQLTMTPEAYRKQQLDRQRAGIDPSNQGLFDNVQYATAADAANAAARAAADALAATNKSYQDQIDTFNKAGKTAAQVRALEIAGMDASTVKLYDLVKAYEASAVAASAAAQLASVNKGYEDRIYEYEKPGLTAKQIRDREIEGMDESTVKLYDKLKGLEAAKVAQETFDRTEKERIATAQRDQEDLARQQQRIADEAARAAEQLKSAWQSVTDSIFEEVARIRGIATGNGAQSLASAQAEFAIKNAQAQAGNQDAAKLLPSISQKLIELAEANATSLIDLQRIRARTAASLDATGAILAARFGLTLPSLAVGTNYLPADMMIQAHEGERVIPAADNRALMQMINRPAPADTSNAAQQQASNEMAGLRAEVRSVALSAAEVARMLKRVIKDDKLQTEDA